MELGAVERLINLMTSADKSVRRHSLMVLGLMSSVQTVRKVLAEDKVVPMTNDTLLKASWSWRVLS